MDNHPHCLISITFREEPTELFLPLKFSCTLFVLEAFLLGKQMQSRQQMQSQN